MTRITAAAVFVAALGVATLAVEVDPPDYAASGREVVRIVRDDFFDPARASEWAARHADYAEGVRDAEEFTSRTNEALRWLETSHTLHYPRGTAGFWGLLAIFGEHLEAEGVEYDSIGADVDDRGHVRRVLASGPAAEAEILRGDRLVTVDGRPFKSVGTFEGKAGAVARVGLERAEEGPLLEVTVIPRRINPVQEWLEAQREGARVFSRADVGVGYVPLLWCAGDEAEALMREQIAVTFRDADALILDFRDGWGGCNPGFLNFLNPAPPVITLIDREGQRHGFDPQWRKPLFVLINGGTRSGKEIIAHAVRGRKLGTLVGTTTAGFVVGGRPYLLSDGSMLYLAVMDTLVDGERLEGIGVAPEIHVPDRLEYAAGADPQLERAIEAAVERCRETPADDLFTGAVKPVFYVTDVKKSARFFEEILGFAFDGFANRSDGRPYYAEMLAGTLKFGLHEPTAEGQESRVGKQRLYFRVNDLAAHRLRVAARGGEPGEIKERGWMDMFTVRDPDGNEVVFAHTDPSKHTTDPW